MIVMLVIAFMLGVIVGIFVGGAAVIYVSFKYGDPDYHPEKETQTWQ